MSTYEESAYSEERVTTAAKAAGWDSVEECMADLTSQGSNLSQIAERLELSVQPFWAYWRTWCKNNVKPLRLSEES